MRRLIAGLFGAALVGLVIPSAFAQTGTSAQVAAPANDSVLSGTVNIRGTGSSGSGVDKITISVDGIVVASKSPSGFQTSTSLDHPWNTNLSPAGGISRNGSHSIRVSVTGNLGGSDSHTINVISNNAPSAPSGVSASADGETITVSWAANPEPDIIGYRVERDSGSGFGTAAETQSTSYSHNAKPGTYSYRVYAVRSGGTGSALASAPSGVVSATIVPPPPTDDGGDGGSKGDGDGRGDGPVGRGDGRVGDSEREIEKVFKAGDKVIAPQGLPASISLPASSISLPSLPSIPRDAAAWGEYKQKLPYDLSAAPKGGGLVVPENVAARSPSRFIPPDGLRWIGAGALAFAIASLLMLLAHRLGRPELPELVPTHIVEAGVSEETAAEAAALASAELVLEQAAPNIDMAGLEEDAREPVGV